MYAIKTLSSEEFHKWKDMFKLRSSETNFLKNPFYVDVVSSPYRKYDLRGSDTEAKIYLFTLINIRPVYFNYTIFAWPTLLGLFMFFPYWYLIAPTIGFCCAGIFWTSHFFYFATKLSLKKAGYVGPIEKVSLKKYLEETAF